MHLSYNVRRGESPVAKLLFLIEKMAIHLQDPFENKPTDTPMLTISSNIERDLKQMTKDHYEPSPQHAGKFYVL